MLPVLLAAIIVATVIVATALRSLSQKLVWKGTTFSRGDRVRIKKWAGTKKPERTGHARELDSGPGQTGTAVRKVLRSSGDEWLLLVRWDAQEWREYNAGGRRVKLGAFDDTIHPDHLEHGAQPPAGSNRYSLNGRIFTEGQPVKLAKRCYLSPEQCGRARGVYGRLGQQGTFFRLDIDNRAVVDWGPQEWEEDETKKMVSLLAFSSEVNPESLE